MRWIGCAILGLSLSLCGVASAADISQPQPVYKAPPPAPPPFSWTGFYLGVNIGGAWTTGSVTDTVTGRSLSGNNDGFIGGGQLGFNYQISNWVLGFEWDFDGTSISATSNAVTVGANTIQASAKTDWVSTLAGRLGWAFDRSLLYVKGGGAWVENSATLTNLTTGNSISGSNTNDGWMVGVGWEWAFAPQWSAKIEYNYIGLNSWSPSNTLLVNNIADRLTLSRDIDVVKAGVNYRFNWGAY